MLEIFILVVLFMLSFFFSASEAALTNVNRAKIQQRAEQGHRMSQKLISMLAMPDRMITTILIGNTIVNILLPTILVVIAFRYNWELTVAITVLAAIVIVFGEVLPKTIAITYSDRMAYNVGPFIMLFIFLLQPISVLISGLTTFIMRVISNGAVQEATLTKEDLRTMVDIASTEGTFEEEESDRIKGVLDFQHKDVEDVMGTHRTEIVGVSINATYEEVRDTILEHYYTRYPVYVESMDKIVGMFYSKKLIEWSMDPSMELTELMDDDPLFVVQSGSVEKLFKQMLAKKKHMAIVLDEYGGTLGIVTHEDIIEEMIGQEIEDESDEDEEVLVYEMTDTKLVCHGRLEIEEANEMFHIAIPNDHETVGGFVLQQLGHMPDGGEQFIYENLHVEINLMDRNRILQLTITRREEENEEE